MDTRRWRKLAIFAGVLPVAIAQPVLSQPAPDFARDIEPLLKTHCLACHGAKNQMHALRLDRRPDALRGGDSGAPAIVPGNSSQSLMVKYISGQDPDIVMPPAGPRLPVEQVDLIRRWIDDGANWPESEAVGEAAIQRPKHWSLEPIVRRPPPSLKSNWARTPIDAFILEALQQNGLAPAPEASPQALMRRIYLDLTGLPPTIEEQRQFLARPNVDELVNDLLSRPTYGERWARHWLDLVRYAETNGYERDATKPSAWRYRDYVINAFNQDKPFDRFTLEQLAGDELPDASAETFTALGYYRLGPWDDEPADPKTDRFDQLDDIVSTTSQVFLGLTLGCARCHNHKFEPLTARDYYSMLAVFNGLERPQKGRTELDRPAGTWEQIDAIDARDREIDTLKKRLVAISPTAAAGASTVLGEIEELRRETPDIARAYYLYEPRASIPPAFLMIRGKADQPGPKVDPDVPEILQQRPLEIPSPGRTSFRRLALARWLVSPENPLTARVIVNRIWQHHFGEGLVRTPSDFGVMGSKPTHPELLDWLAAWFVDNGWSVKKLHRLILSSNAYRMNKQHNEAFAEKDPENLLLWRMPYRRLEAEAIRDSVLAVSGQLNPQMFGPSVYPHIPPAALEGSSDPDKIWKESSERESSRRTIYVFLKRSMIVPMLEVLDLCDTSRTTAQRLNTSVPTQALTLFNGDFINRQAKHFADRLRREAGPDSARQVELAYRLALARPPAPEESQKLIAFLKDQPLEQLCRVIFNLNEFAYAE